MTLAAGIGDAVANTVVSGSLLAAMPVALAAGTVSFLSPCVLPLVPGYLSYVTGMSGADIDQHRRGRMLLGSLLFVLGFSVVFVATGALFGGVGALLQQYSGTITRVLGVATIVLGVSFLGIIPVPGLQRDLRFHTAPTAGLAGAPMLGILFGLGWTPCIGPTLAAVQTLAFDSASAGRGALLAFTYCLGLGLPFVLTGLAYRRALGAFGAVRRHSVWVMRFGGGMLIALGILLVTGLWTDVTIAMRSLISGFRTPI